MKKCPFCAEEIQDEAVVCKHCGRELPAQAPPPPPQPAAAPAKRKTSCLAIGCLGLLIGVVLLIILGKVMESSLPKRAPQAAASASGAPSTVLYAQSEGVKVRNAPKGDAPVVRKLGLAERVVSVKRDGEWVKLDGTGDQWVHATLVGPDRPESPEEKKQRLADEKQKAANERLAGKLARELYAKNLREQFLDKGFDIKVRVSGAQSERITYQFVLFTDVWSHRFQKDGLINQAAKLGFKRVDMTDGYHWHVYWDL
jgi:hypothetical protein